MYGINSLYTFRRKLLLLIECVIFIVLFMKNILICFLSFQCHSFASGPVLEANAFDTKQREGKAVCIHSLMQRDAPYPCSILKLPITNESFYK